jgi:hypothetical protein
MKLNPKYLPKNLSKKDYQKQLKNIRNTMKNYKKHKYINRPHLESFRSKPSKHVFHAMKMYNVPNIRPTRALSKKTGCSLGALKKIVNKGEGAYYSSGSRPNQTAQSWGIARLASAITGGNAAKVDKDILIGGCTPKSRALREYKKSVKN